MASIQELLDMIYSDAVGAGLPDHYFDEARNHEFIERDNLSIPPKRNMQQPAVLRHIHYVRHIRYHSVGLVENPITGNIHWTK